MGIFRWLFVFFFGDIAERYFKRYITPQIRRAAQLGIPREELDEMWEIALNLSGPYQPPGIILRNLIDQWEEVEHAQSPNP